MVSDFTNFNVVSDRSMAMPERLQNVSTPWLSLNDNNVRFWPKQKMVSCSKMPHNKTDAPDRGNDAVLRKILCRFEGWEAGRLADKGKSR